MTTLAEAQAKYNEALAAESQALMAKETRLTSAGGIDRVDIQQDLRDIRKSVVYWKGEVARLSAKASGLPTFGGMTFTSANFGNSTRRE